MPRHSHVRYRLNAETAQETPLSGSASNLGERDQPPTSTSAGIPTRHHKGIPDSEVQRSRHQSHRNASHRHHRHNHYITPLPQNKHDSIPRTHHLLITTPSAVYAWDFHGLHVLFTSSKKGILAAKEAKDGSRMLAVADRHTVVLQDCQRGRREQRSWGLGPGDDEAVDEAVRLLEYSSPKKPVGGRDGKDEGMEGAEKKKEEQCGKLFLSTSLTGTIQCYTVAYTRTLSSQSRQSSRDDKKAQPKHRHRHTALPQAPSPAYLHSTRETLEVSKTHPTQPTVMALSPDSTLLLSASKDPTIIYLQDLRSTSLVTQLKPIATTAHVTVAAFHPERKFIFLLAFSDGVIAAYDGSKIVGKAQHGKDNLQRLYHGNGGAGEIGRLDNVHRATNRAHGNVLRE